VICAECGERPATCVGRYEHMTECVPACDECCGHGCEDGHCDRVEPDDIDDGWECSCGEIGEGGIAGAHTHLQQHMDKTNVHLATQELEE
jgi:hypothetical protein